MMGHLNSFSASGGGNLNKNFAKNTNARGCPGGGMLKLRFDWYITKTPDSTREKNEGKCGLQIGVKIQAIKSKNADCRHFNLIGLPFHHLELTVNTVNRLGGGVGIFGFADLANFWFGFSVFAPKNCRCVLRRRS